MKRIYNGRLITQPLIFFLMLGAIHNMTFAKSQLCVQTSIIESIVDDISDHIGGCTVCDTLGIIDSKIDALNPFTLCDVCGDLSIIDSKIDALSPSSCNLSVLESIVDSISNKIGGCTVCDQLTIIENDLTTITNDLSVIDSKIDALSPSSCNVSAIESIVDSISNKIGGCTVCDQLTIIENDLTTITNDLSVIDSKIDALSPSSCNVSAIESIVDSISSKIGGCTVCDQLTIIENDLTTITNDLSVIDSKIDALSPSSCNVSVIESIVDSISNKIGGCTVCDQLTIIENDLTTITNDLSVIDSKIDALDTDFSGIATEATASIIESVVDSISNKIGGCTVCDQLSIIESDLTTITNDLSVIDSKIDALSPSSCDLSVIDSIVDSISNKIGGCTVCDQLTIIENDLTTITNDLSVIDSKIDALSPSSCNVSVVESIVDSISNKIGGCTVCDQLTIIESDLTTITNDLSVIDSKIDALSPSSCDVSVIDSIVDSISNKIGGCTVCDQLTIIENDLTTITNDLSVIDSKIDALSPSSCNVSVIDSIVDSISNKIGGCTVCDQLTIIESDLTTITNDLSVIDSKIDALSPSSCNVSVIDSIVDSISNKIGGCTVCDQLTVIENDLTTITNDLSVIDSKIDALSPASCNVSVIESIVDSISNKIGGCTVCDQLTIIESDLTTITNDLSVIDSKIDALSPSSCNVSVLESIVDSISNKIGGCTVCDQLTIIESDLTTITNDLSVIDSKIDALSPSSCDVCSFLEDIDSKIDILESPCNATAITGSVTITQPGNYCVANSFSGSIIIASNDVYLDLNERTISNQSTNVIEVQSGFSQIVITNGYVISIGAVGIKVNTNCSIITISKIKAINCNQGIWLDTVNTSNIVNCEMLSSVTGLQIDSSTTINVNNSVAQNNTQAGIALNACNDCCIVECKATGNGTGTLGIDTYGIVSDSGSCNIFEKCIVLDTEIIGTFTCPPACFVPYMDPLVIQDCTISVTAASYGIALLNAEQNSKVIDCEVGCTQVSGFIDCGCDRVLSPNPVQAFGIAIDNSLTATNSELIGIAQGATTSDSDVNSVAWLVCADQLYLAAGQLAENLDVFKFNATSANLEHVATSIPFTFGRIRSVAWLVCDGNQYLATGITNDSEISVEIFEFDSTSTILNEISSTTTGGNLFSIAWLVTGTQIYLAAGGSSSPQVNIFEFNTTTSNLDFITSTTSGTVFSVAWLTTGTQIYLATGGIGSSQVNIFEFDVTSTTSILSEVATASAPGGGILSVAWLVCDGKNYLATGGLDTNEVNIFEFDLTPNFSLTNVASTSALDGLVFSVAWIVKNGKNYLATGGVGTNSVKVFEFDVASTTSLTEVAATSAIQAGVNSIAWLTNQSASYLAAGGPSEAGSNQITVFDFNQTPTFLENNIIKNNLIYNTSGIGINGDSSTNLIAGNIAYNNNQNYGAGILSSFINNDGIGGIALDSLLNRSLPPLISSSITNTDITDGLSIIESIIESISNQIGDCILCDELSIIDSKINALSISAPCDPTPITQTYNIVLPGNYCVANSFNGFITISSSDVYLDLNERSITNNDGNAIEIVSQMERVIITNGYVTGSQAGVKVDNACRAITISDVQAIDCDNQGIWLDNVTASKIIGCEMLSSITGLQIDSSTQINIKNSTAQKNTQAGIALSACNDCCVIECKAIDNGKGTGGVDTYGIVSDSGSCNIFEKCIALDTEIAGVAVTCSPLCFVPYMDPLVVQDCTILTTTAVTCGIALVNNEQNSKVIDCEVGCTHASNVFPCVGCEWILSPNPIAQSFGIGLDANASNESLTLNSVASDGNGAGYAAWLSCGGTKYLATGSTAPLMIPIFEFDGTTLNLVTSVNGPDTVASPAWVVDNDTKYLIVADNVLDSLLLYEFDTNSTSLDFIASQTTDLGNQYAIAWLVNGCDKYFAVGGDNGLEIFIFDPTSTSSMSVVATFTSLITVDTVAWLVSEGTPYLAAAGTDPDAVTNEVTIFSFDPVTFTLTPIVTDSIDFDGTIFSTAWFVCNGINYLATGGASTNEITIFEFNTTTSSLDEVTSTDNVNGSVFSVAWLVCNGINYLATGGENDNEITIFEFDTTMSTLTVIATGAVGTVVNSVAWLVDNGTPYLATESDDGTVIFNFGCGVSPVFPIQNIVQRNLVYNTNGIGIDGDGSTNLIVANVAYNNSSNYGDEVGNIFSGGIGSTVPDPLLNRSL